MKRSTERFDLDAKALDLVTPLKGALRRMLGTVALITTRDPETGMPAGMAATAVIPVSMEPPSMLISINRKASAHSVIERSGLFCINILGAKHSDLVGLFSNSEKREERFARSMWEERNGLPFLPQAPASIFCKVSTTLLFGSHEVFVGEVFDLNEIKECEPLGWFEGSFATAKPFNP